MAIKRALAAMATLLVLGIVGAEQTGVGAMAKEGKFLGAMLKAGAKMLGIGGGGGADPFGSVKGGSPPAAIKPRGVAPEVLQAVDQKIKTWSLNEWNKEYTAAPFGGIMHKYPYPHFEPFGINDNYGPSGDKNTSLAPHNMNMYHQWIRNRHAIYPSVSNRAQFLPMSQTLGRGFAPSAFDDGRGVRSSLVTQGLYYGQP